MAVGDHVCDRVWTNHPLTAARHLYLLRGLRLVGEEPHHSFGVDLVGQVYELHLHNTPSTDAHGCRDNHAQAASAEPATTETAKPA